VDSTASQLNEAYFGFRPMRAVFSDRQRVQGMLDFEAALARAQVQAGLVPQRFADIISSHCQAQHFDLQALSQATMLAGNPAIPLVKQLGRLIAAEDEEAENAHKEKGSYRLQVWKTCCFTRSFRSQRRLWGIGMEMPL